jgi:tRNA pseudouridine38-40 synthase
MPRYKLTLEYNGTGLAGWQRQPAAPSVQQYFEEAIEKFCGEQVRLHVAGRTDAGVHAWGQVAHVDLARDFRPVNVMGGLNFHLRPARIAVVAAEKVDENFHARFSAKKRYYCYRIINRRAPLILDEDRAWFVPVPLNVEKMREAAAYLIGEHDFTSLRDSECQAKSPIKTLDEVRIEQCGELIELHVSARSFLHHMVRNITGTLKFVGEGKWEPEEIPKILAAKERKAAGPTAPPGGLYFVRVEY